MYLPPRNANGSVRPHDHHGITLCDGVIRRISEQQLVSDQSTGRKRISSIAFKASSGPNGGMSVDLQRLIEEAGLDPRIFVTTPRWMGSVRFNVGSLRKEDFLVGYDPLPDNPYHGEVWDDFSKVKQRRLRELATWFVPIAGVDIS